MLDPNTDFAQYASAKLDRSFRQIRRCAEALTADQLWHRPNERSNSIGNLILHLTGNVRQWIVSGLGGEPFHRDRPAEFARRDTLPAAELLHNLQETVRRACQVIGRMGAPELTNRYTIQGYGVSGLTAVLHVVEHFSLHTGQIVYATKLLADANLSLYDAQGHLLDDSRPDLP